MGDREATSSTGISRYFEDGSGYAPGNASSLFWLIAFWLANEREDVRRLVNTIYASATITDVSIDLTPQLNILEIAVSPIYQEILNNHHCDLADLKLYDIFLSFDAKCMNASIEEAEEENG